MGFFFCYFHFSSWQIFAVCFYINFLLFGDLKFIFPSTFVYLIENKKTAYKKNVLKMEFNSVGKPFSVCRVEYCCTFVSSEVRKILESTEQKAFFSLIAAMLQNIKKASTNNEKKTVLLCNWKLKIELFCFVWWGTKNSEFSTEFHFFLF